MIRWSIYKQCWPNYLKACGLPFKMNRFWMTYLIFADQVPVFAVPINPGPKITGSTMTVAKYQNPSIDAIGK
jgi:hypothetical protein